MRTRRMRMVLTVMAASVLGLSGCAPSSGQAAPASGAALEAMAVQTAVGPVPGPPRATRAQPNPYRSLRGASAEGRDLFVRFNCSGCHGGRAGGGMGPSLRDVDWIYGRTDAQIFSSIAAGRAHGMPAWGARLTEEQVWKLVTYVESLRTPDEPHPPTE